MRTGGNDSVTWKAEPGRWGTADLVAVVIWTVAVVSFFWEVVSFRGALFYFDVTELNFPYREFFARELRMGRFSRWCPGLYCGLPLYSESQAGYLHPLKYVFYPWLPTWKAFNLDMVASVWLTGFGTFGWLRRHVGTRGALTGAAVLALGGFEWAHFIHTSMVNALSSVPFLLWATEWAWDRGRTAGIVLAAIALACQVFAGHLQDTLLTSALLGLYTLYRAVTETDLRARLTVVATAAGVVGLGVALSAVQWVPSKELLDRSPRAGGLTWENLTYGSWHPELLPTLVVREAYGTRARDTDWMDGFYPYHEMNAYLGLTALALAAVGAGASRDRWVAFWLLLAIVGGLLMLGRFTCLFDFAHRVPVAGSSRIPVRFHLWATVAVAALAGVGVDRLERGSPVRLRVPGLLIAGLVVLSIPILIYVYAPALTNMGRWNLPYHVARYRWLARELTVASLRTLLVGSLGIGALATAARTNDPRLRRLACGLLPLVVLGDLFGAHWYDAPVVSPRYWTLPPATVAALKADPSLIRVFGVAEKHAGEPGYASETVDFLRVRDPLAWSLPIVWGLSSSNGQTPIIPSRLLRYTDKARIRGGRFDIESVSHILTPRRPIPEFLSAMHVGDPMGSGAALIYKNPGVLPRARLIGQPYYARDETDAVAGVVLLGPRTRERLVVEDHDRPLGQDSVANGTARITRDEPEHVEVQTESAGPSYLFLADTFDPGWSATVDGRPAPIRPAYVAFRAVYLGPGRHRVVFRYRPAGFQTGLAFTGVGLALGAALLLMRRMTASRRPAHDVLAWPARWPLCAAVGAAVVVAVSAIGVGQGGTPVVNARWSGSFHQFTWGAGIEAMRNVPGG